MRDKEPQRDGSRYQFLYYIVVQYRAQASHSTPSCLMICISSTRPHQFTPTPSIDNRGSILERFDRHLFAEGTRRH